MTSAGPALLDLHDVLLADLDGTLYRGRVAVPGAVEAVAEAARRGVRTAYVTNNASRSPADVAAHLVELLSLPDRLVRRRERWSAPLPGRL